MSARDVTATLICPTTWCIARRWTTNLRFRAATVPTTMPAATIAAESRKPAVTQPPPLA